MGAIARGVALSAALLLAGCHTHLLLQTYSVAWPQASNDVRAWGDRAMARAARTWRRRATLDVDPVVFGQARGARWRAAFLADGALRRVGTRWAFTPAARAQSVPCGEPAERGVDCRRFVVGGLTNVQPLSYDYQSGDFETGPDPTRTLTFRFRSAPSTALGRALAARGLLVCMTGYKTTQVRYGNDVGTDTKPVYRPWTPRTWCLGAVGDGPIEPIGPDFPY